MVNLNSLISTSDFFILLLFSLLAYAAMRSFIFKDKSKSFYQMFKIFFLLKVLSGVLMSLLTIYYWKEGDAIFYYSEGQNLIQLIKRDFTNIKYLFIPLEYYQNRISLDNELIKTYNGSGVESSFLMSKFCAILYYPALGKYLLVNFFFGLFSTIAQVKLYLVVLKRYPHLKKAVALCILFMPTLLLYSTSIFKETLCLSFIGFAFFNFQQIVNSKNTALNSFFLLLNLYLIFVVKSYVLFAFLLAILLVLFFQFVGVMFRHSLITRSFIFLFIAGLLLMIYNKLDFFDPYAMKFVDTSNFYQQYYNNDFGETSSFEIGEIETTLKGLLGKMPIGIYTTYFRPHLWEVKKPIVLFSALESFLILAFAVWAFFKNGRYLFALIREDFFARLAMYYAIVLGIIIGLTTFNFGTLIRYKVPVVPFAWLFVFLLFYYKPKRKPADPSSEK